MIRRGRPQATSQDLFETFCLRLCLAIPVLRASPKHEGRSSKFLIVIVGEVHVSISASSGAKVM